MFRRRTSRKPLELRIQALRLEPGDIVIVRSPERLSQAAYARIKEQVGDQFPGHAVLVFENGMDLSVARRAVTTATIGLGSQTPFNPGVAPRY